MTGRSSDASWSEFVAAQDGDGVAWLREAGRAHLELEPGRVLVILGLARVETEMAQYEQADQYLDRLELLASMDQRSRLAGIRGMHAFDRGQRAEAEVLLRKRLATDPGADPEWRVLVDLLVATDRAEEAEALCRERLAAEARDSAEALLVLGRLLRARRAYDEAEASLARAVELAPRDPEIAELLADVREASSIRTRRDAEEFQGQWARLEAWQDLGRFASMREELECLAAWSPRAREDVLLSARCSSGLGRYAEAAETLAARTRAEPSGEAGEDALARLLRQAGHVEDDRRAFDRAAEFFRAAIEHSSDPRADAGAYIFLGACLGKQGQLQEAREAFESALECEQGAFDEVDLNLGLIARAEGRYDDAALAFERALAMDSSYDEAREALKDVERAIALREGR